MATPFPIALISKHYSFINTTKSGYKTVIIFVLYPIFISFIIYQGIPLPNQIV
jgi:hypothetical protein